MWKDIIGFEGYYQINENGEVRSVDRYVNNNGTQVLRKGKIIKSHLDSGGYYQITLFVKNKGHRFMLHQLVAMNFIDNPNNLKEINHIDHDKTNCHVSNLEWVTRQENQQKMVIFHGGRVFKNCPTCNSEFSSKKSDNQIYCSRSCVPKSVLRKVERPTKEELLELIKNNTMVKVGNMFNVSDNAVRKWCRDYDLPFKKKDIDKFK